MAIVQISRIQHRRGLADNLPQLSHAELGWVTDTRSLYIGNGPTSSGAPIVGNTQVLTEHSNIVSLLNYTYEGNATSTVQTGATAGAPTVRKLQDRLEITGLIAGLFSIAIQSFIDFHFHIIAILMIMGFMCARIQEISGQYYSELKRSFIPENYLSKKAYMLTAGIVPVILLNYCFPVAIADYHWKKAKEQIKNGQIKNGELTLKLAAEWNPNNIRVHFQKFLLYKDALRHAKNHALEGERKVLFANSLLILNKIENINTLAAIVPESKGHLLIENTDIVIAVSYTHLTLPTNREV